jgi:hypothetical protein
MYFRGCAGESRRHRLVWYASGSVELPKRLIFLKLRIAMLSTLGQGHLNCQ